MRGTVGLIVGMIVGLIVAVGACGFRATPDDAVALIDATTTTPPQPLCDPTVADLVACYDFDGDAKDASSNHLDLSPSHASFVLSPAGMALQFGIESSADHGDGDVYNLAALTMEAWIQPTQLPDPGKHAVIMDVDRQYDLQLREDGRVTCGLVGGHEPVDLVPPHIVAGAWTHVACTYDGSTALLYINGVVAATGVMGGALHTEGDSGMSIGADNPPKDGDRSRFIGLIDELRLMSVARSATDLCHDAGKPLCP
jgi:hypothetical protein